MVRRPLPGSARQHFERCDFLADNRSSGEHVTRQEAETEGVGVLYNDHILHMQVEVAPEGRSRSGCTRYEPCLHNVHPDMWVRSSADERGKVGVLWAHEPPSSRSR